MDFFRGKASEDLGTDFDIHQCIWFNKHVRLKSKQYFYYDSWYDKGIFLQMIYYIKILPPQSSNPLMT